jgi:segregation and condensation protein A
VAGVAVLKDEYRVERSDGEPAFTVDLDGFEGPLDLLLELARRQKVDLARISVLALAEQYLAFVEAAHTMRLELAADYLVMAAWLAYLKSRLLLPAPAKAEGGDPAELADALAQRLRRLEQIRKAAEALLNRPRLGRDVFARGAPEAIAHSTAVVYEATLYGLLSAYARQRQKHARAHVRLEARVVWSLAEAREALTRLLGQASDWTDLDSWLIAYGVEPKMRRTARASSLSASLEMVREGQIELRQDRAFAPLWVRAVRREASPDATI